jgi:asparagine synthase (glutamine-hydrolysing)
MCGIAALYEPDARPSEAAGERMIAALRHRGPDGEGVHISGPALLAHTRLAIIDVAGGDQPLLSEDGRCAVVVNGEIYNHVELRRELERRGHRFKTRSDSEVIVHGYEEHGAESLGKLNGIFGFALWDERRARLLVARDQLGVKPVYWWTDGRRVAAASEIGALLALGVVTPRIDPVALDHYLAWRFVPSPRTLFAGISKLAPGTLLTADDSGVRVRDYRAAPGGPLTEAAPEELEAELASALQQAIRRQMMSDVPYGCFLSGGLDSAAIAVAMSRACDLPPRTFTIGFPGSGDVVDERRAAAQTAAAVRAEHGATAMREEDFPTAVARCVRRLEEPCGTASAPAALQLSHFAAQSVKVVLSGQGADEPLGGYQRHQAAAALGLLDRLPRGAGFPLCRLAEALPRNERAKRAARLLAEPSGTRRLLRIFEIADRVRVAELTGRSGAEAAEERHALAAGVLECIADRGALEQMLYLDTHLFLPDGLLVYGDKMSMAHGLEQRVPFLDLELLRLVERIPADLRVRRLERKWLYRRALQSIVPAEALARRKHPFATPYDRWLRTSLGAEVARRYAPGSELGALLAPATVERLVREHASGRDDHKRLLYCLLELSEWHGAFLNGRPVAEEPEPAAAAVRQR